MLKYTWDNGGKQGYFAFHDDRFAGNENDGTGKRKLPPSTVILMMRKWGELGEDTAEVMVFTWCLKGKLLLQDVPFSREVSERFVVGLKSLGLCQKRGDLFFCKQ